MQKWTPPSTSTDYRNNERIKISTKRNFLLYDEADFKNYIEYLTHDGDKFYDRNFLNRVNKQT